MVAPICGNFVVEDGELCDDGNEDPLDGCTVGCTPTRAVSIGIGPISYHTCAILSDGTARCWGLNEQGQLGYGGIGEVGDDEPPSSMAAIEAPGDNNPRFLMLLGTERSACALTTAGQVFCWGSRIEGRTGDGQFMDCAIPDICESDLDLDDPPVFFGELGPADNVDIPGGKVIDLAAGNGFACAVTSDRNVSCWGRNTYGQLGVDHTTCVGTTCKPLIEQVDLGAAAGTVVQVAAGVNHTCVRLDEASDNNVMCWGHGHVGQLGYGNLENVGDGLGMTPATRGRVPLSGTATDLCTGTDVTCVVRTDGHVRCWGLNTNGQLGQEDEFNRGGSPETTPAKLPDIVLDTKVRKVRCGERHVCALTIDGAIKCWGLGIHGALGYANSSDVGNAPERPADAGDVDLGGLAIDIAVGEYHTCALLDTSEIRCWGIASSGQLGYGDPKDLDPYGDQPGETPANAGNVPFYDPDP